MEKDGEDVWLASTDEHLESKEVEYSTLRGIIIRELWKLQQDLGEQSPEITLTELARAVTAAEAGTSTDELTEQSVRIRVNLLVKFHLTELDDFGVLVWEPDREVIIPTPALQHLVYAIVGEFEGHLNRTIKNHDGRAGYYIPQSVVDNIRDTP